MPCCQALQALNCLSIGAAKEGSLRQRFRSHLTPDRRLRGVESDTIRFGKFETC
jgi:hypothetical protein